MVIFHFFKQNCTTLNSIVVIFILYLIISYEYKYNTIYTWFIFALYFVIFLKITLHFNYFKLITIAIAFSLNSIFIRCLFSTVHKELTYYKFRYNYIYTIMITNYNVNTYDFKFHSDYIYTITIYQNGNVELNFKFHSGYIYTLYDCIKKSSKHL